MQDVRLTAGFGGRRSKFRQKASVPLCVGEAAGLQDYLWGFGIRYALHSAALDVRPIHGRRIRLEKAATPAVAMNSWTA